MSYLVLARKYRPKTFAQLVGQSHVVQALSNALQTQRLHHAYLFTGTRGMGKTTVSRILAKSLNCEKGITSEPCGSCEMCLAIDAGRFVDYTELDAASNRGVDEVQQLLEQAVYKPVQGRFKVFMIDEVQCGMGRTGKWFAHQWAGILPDVMPLAKGLGSGVPVGAVVAGPKAAHIFEPGNHGSTFGGNPLAMRAGIETIAIMERDHLIDNAAKMGAYLKASLERELAGVAGFVQVKGKGLMIGVELDRPCSALMGLALDAGLLLSVTADCIVRLVPALIIEASHCDEIVATLVPLIKKFLKPT